MLETHDTILVAAVAPVLLAHHPDILIVKRGYGIPAIAAATVPEYHH